MTDSAPVRIGVGMAVAAVLLGACAPSHDAAADPGGTSSPQTPAVSSPSEAPTQAASSTPESKRTHRPYSDVNPPPRRGGDFVVEVLIVTRLGPRTDRHPQRHTRTGQWFWGEEVRTCVTRSSRHSEHVGWNDWRAEATDGHIYTADPHDWRPLRTPTYPFGRTLKPGQCATGYWLITAPKGTDVSAIQFAPDNGPALIEWPTLR